MRKLYAGLFISLDGVVEAPDKWQKVFDDDMGAELSASTEAADAMLLGRKTYQEWSNYWPQSTDPFATFINNTPKYVASTTLDKVSWGSHNTVTLLKGSLADEINRLKQQPGKNINLAGSATLVESLVRLNLLDILMLMIHPIIVGKGKRLFGDGSITKQLQLVSAKPTSSGTIIATYHPAG
jgi:dihydrofolate reductase